MSWLTGFEFDIFLSYARVDNSTAERDPERGWVSQFHRHLEVALSKKVGRLDTVRIWRDVRELRGNQLFDKSIQDAIQASAVFVALSSRGYLESEYCRQELQWFFEKGQSTPAGLAVGDDYRIFNILLNNIPASGWPAEYARSSGFPFHDAAEFEHDGEPVDPTSPPFQSQLRKLTESLYRTLCRLKGQPTARDVAEAASANRVTVYLAETADSLGPVRKRILSELKDAKDVAIAARVPPPFEAAAHDEAARGGIAAADVSVHLLDRYPGREIVDQEGMSYPRRQVELALAHGKAPLILVPSALTRESIEDEGHAAFLEQLEHGDRADSKYHFQRELPSAMTRQILSMVEQLKGQRAASARDTVGATLLDTHLKDQIHAFELGQYLLKRKVETLINPQEDDPEKNLAIFTERLKKVAILIVFFGAVPWDWVRERLKLALQISVAEQCPLRACGVYLAPPQKLDPSRKFQLPLVTLEWMDHTHGFNPSAVDRLVTRAQAVGASP